MEYAVTPKQGTIKVDAYSWQDLCDEMLRCIERCVNREFEPDSKEIIKFTAVHIGDENTGAEAWPFSVRFSMICNGKEI